MEQENYNVFGKIKLIDTGKTTTTKKTERERERVREKRGWNRDRRLPPRDDTEVVLWFSDCVC